MDSKIALGKFEAALDIIYGLKAERVFSPDTWDELRESLRQAEEEIKDLDYRRDPVKLLEERRARKEKRSQMVDRGKGSGT